MAIFHVLGQSVIPFLVIIVFLVVAHELGHFFMAKLFGIRVLEFGLFYPPRIWGRRFGKKPVCPPGPDGEEAECEDERTIYTINVLPLGGFVRLLGEEDASDPRSLAAKPRGIRFVVLASGAVVNLLLPVLLFAIYYMIPQPVAVGIARITSIEPNSPAQHAGLQAGDQILSIDGQRITSLDDAATDIRLRWGQTMTWVIKRTTSNGLGSQSSQTLTKQVYARWNPPEIVDPQTGQREREGAVGIGLGSPAAFTQTVSYAPWDAVPKAVTETYDSYVLLRNQIISWVAERSAPQSAFAGPVGIAQATGEVVNQAGWAALLLLAAQLSISLGIINLLPLPMLDGGRILFVLIEIVRGGKRIAPEKEALVHFIGFVALISLVAVFTYFDISRIVHGGSLLR
jgi:regulator of sigma E protease